MSFACRPNMGGKGQIVALVTDTVAGQSADPSSAGVTMSFNPNGTITYAINDAVANGPLNDRWNTGSGEGGNYWIKRTLTSGTLTDDPGSGVLALTSTRNFGVVRNAPPGTKTCTATYEIFSDAGGTVQVAAASITLTADVSV